MFVFTEYVFGDNAGAHVRDVLVADLQRKKEQ